VSAPKFTPGPWTIKTDSEGGYAFVEILGADGLQVANLESGGDAFDAQTEADAQLIAAAPELLEALREAREWILGEGSIVPERLVGRMSAALAKAVQP
jgi:hypothetical protein